MKFRILELFSGIGGMHYAFKYAQLETEGDVIAAMDINTVANAVYAHNHNTTQVLNNNIQRLSVKTLQKLDINMLLMSPPCQPHTRVGNQRDVEDNRSDALRHLCTLLCDDNLRDTLSYVLMENVKGFEKSQARDEFVAALQTAEFHWREFILSPTQFGVPNTRFRYYCLARKKIDFPFVKDHLWLQMPAEIEHSGNLKISIRSILQSEESITAEVQLPEKVLNKRVWLMDIVSADSVNTMCFTKAYTHYSEGTGSIFSPLDAAEVQSIFKQVKQLEEQEQQTEETLAKRFALLHRLKLRYFTPREVARLMSFPESFDFPASTTNRQKYRLLGNSINVCVVGELIKLLCSA